MNRCYLNILSLLVCMSSWPVYAETKLGEVVERFIQVSPLLQAAEAQKRESEHLYREAKSKFFPEVSVVAQVKDRKINSASFGLGSNMSSAFGDIPSEFYLAGLQVEQPLYLGGRIWNAYRVRKFQKQAAQYSFVDAKRQSLGALLRSVIELDSIEKSLEVLKTSQARQKEYVAITRSKRKRGIARDYELDQARADFLSYAPRIEALTNAKVSLVERISVELEWGKARIKGLSMPFKAGSFKNVQGKVGEWQEKAKGQRTDIFLALNQVEQAKVTKWVDLGDHLPSVSLSASWTSQATDTKDLLHRQADSRDIALNFKIPIFSGLSSQHVKRAGNERVYAAEKNLLKVRRQMQVDVKNSQDQVLSAIERVKQAGIWEEAAVRALKSGLKSYRVGVINSVQVVQLQLGHERAALNKIESLKTYHQAVLQWHLAVGDDLEQVYR